MSYNKYVCLTLTTMDNVTNILDSQKNGMKLGIYYKEIMTSD